MGDDEVRWELGERVMAEGWYVPGLFVFVYGAVIGWKHTKRAIARLASSGRRAGGRQLALPPPRLALPPPRDEALPRLDR